MGRAQSPSHYVIKESEKKEQQVPVISIDYMYMKTGESDEITEDGQPILVMRDRRSKIVTAHVIEEKGANEYAVKRLSQDLKLTGYRKIIFKSDNEPAIIALKQGVKKNDVRNGNNI